MNRIACIALICFATSCNSNLSPPKPTSAPVEKANGSQKRFDYAEGGIAISYPADWKPVPNTKSQLEVSAPDNGKGAGTLSMDVPHMPAIAMLGVPIGQVQSGYVDDAKKQMPDVTASDLALPAIAGVQQHGLKLTGHQNGKVMIEETDLIVRNNQVYILAVKSDDKNEPFVHSVLEGVIKSVQWTK